MLARGGPGRAARRATSSSAARESLVPETLAQMDEPGGEFAAAAERLRTVGRERLSIEERKRRRRALDTLGIEGFDEYLLSLIHI